MPDVEPVVLEGEAAALARELAARTGEDPAGAVRALVSERLEGLATEESARPSPYPKTEEERQKLIDHLNAIALRIARAPDLDPRSPEEIVRYGEHGEPI